LKGGAWIGTGKVKRKVKEDELSEEKQKYLDLEQFGYLKDGYDFYEVEDFISTFVEML
jgi:hypothetical protein